MVETSIPVRTLSKSAVLFAGAFGIAAGLCVTPPAKADAAPILKVEAVSPKGTGTMHYADELRLGAGDPLSWRSRPILAAEDSFQFRARNIQSIIRVFCCSDGPPMAVACRRFTRCWFM
jgi:hypothetical protein